MAAVQTTNAAGDDDDLAERVGQCLLSHPLALNNISVCACVCDVFILQPASLLIYGIDLDGEGQNRTISG